jgi:hypothetical protein
MFDSLLGSNLEPYRPKMHRYRLKQMYVEMGLVDEGSEGGDAD